MSATGASTAQEVSSRIRSEIRQLFAADRGRKAAIYCAVLFLLLLAINGLNVLNSYVGRDFISSIENKNWPRFIEKAWLYVGVFGVSTVAAVTSRFIEETLGLLWRKRMTQRLLSRYLDGRAYYRLHEAGAVQNPDQRIAEDVHTFTTTTLSFALMTANSTITVFAFSGVLWSIRPELFFAAVVYALAGSVLIVRLGQPLVGLNNQQLDKEANLRTDLLHLRENAGSIAVLHNEASLQGRLLQKLQALVLNTRAMIAVNRNLGFLSNGYNYLIQVIPVLMVAPLFMRGEVTFGVVTQSAMAFTFLTGAFSLLITQFQSISTYAAVVQRLGKLIDAIEEAHAPPSSLIRITFGEQRLVYEQLSLRDPSGGLLLDQLNLAIEPPLRVLVRGETGHAKLALFKATAGLDVPGGGSIRRPDAEHLLFVPERPYLPRASARELLSSGTQVPSDPQALAVLHELQLDSLLRADGGLDIECDWAEVLSAGDQIKMALAQVMLARPVMVFLDRLNTALEAAEIDNLLRLLTSHGIPYVLLGKPGDCLDCFDAALDIAADGSWTWNGPKSSGPAAAGAAPASPSPGGAPQQPQ
jgi:putative ATP-binding cassette transporter